MATQKEEKDEKNKMAIQKERQEKAKSKKST